MNRLFLFLVLSAFVVGGCTTGPGGGGGDGPYSGGSTGLNLEFGPGTPLSSFDKGEPMPFKVLLSNLGEYDIPKDTIRVQFFNMNFNNWNNLDGNYKLVTGELPGVSDSFPEPMSLEANMGMATYTGPVVDVKNLDANIRACYPYKTNVFTKTCSDSRRIRETTDEEDLVCDIDGNKLSSGSVSGGPVQVKSIKEEYVGNDRLQYQIEIDNVDEGVVIDKDSSCDYGLADRGLVYIQLPDKYTCSFQSGRGPRGKINIDSGLKVIYCEVLVDGHYEDDLVFDLSYKYVVTETKPIEIVPAV